MWCIGDPRLVSNYSDADRDPCTLMDEAVGANLERADTSGGPVVSSWLSLQAVVACGSNRAGAAEAPVAAGSQKSSFRSRNASRGLIN